MATTSQTTSTPVVPIEEIHIGDAGLNFDTVLYDQTGTVMDVSQATTLEYHFQKPDGTVLIVAARNVTDGRDGVIRYTTSASDFDQTGTWLHQVKTVIGPVVLWSNIGKFKVYGNIPTG